MNGNLLAPVYEQRARELREGLEEIARKGYCRRGDCPSIAKRALEKAK